MSNTSRRAFLTGSLGVAALTLSRPGILAAWERYGHGRQGDRTWLSAALLAERWLRSVEIGGSGGLYWPVDPRDPSKVQTDLYTGMSGIVLFYLELHAATQDETFLDRARRGADYLLASLPDESADADSGLYSGLAGTGIVMQHVWRATGDIRYRDGIWRVLRRLASSARRAGKGVEWTPSTDIISGSAGIGLSLIALAHDAPPDVDAIGIASLAGDRLIERALPAGEDLTWLVQPDMTRNYPNFSHGTAGVAFFLARIAQVAKQPQHLEAGLAGERWLRSRMTTTVGGGRMIFHSTPGNESLYYLSWCHGPAGTARLYQALALATGNRSYTGTVEQCATAIVDMKVPQRSPGFWNNISQCCGNCGVAEFFVSLHRTTGEIRHLDFAEKVAFDTLERGTRDAGGMKWIQAENRVQPEVLMAQTGLMQGAAGVGLSMLHLDGARLGRKPFVRLPDEIA